uniref:Cytochrome b n=1 Tax=Brugia timori TaxID=42155 RepID=A0A0R3RCF6_9BILA
LSFHYVICSFICYIISVLIVTHQLIVIINTVTKNDSAIKS